MPSDAEADCARIWGRDVPIVEYMCPVVLFLTKEEAVHGIVEIFTRDIKEWLDRKYPPATTDKPHPKRATIKTSWFVREKHIRAWVEGKRCMKRKKGATIFQICGRGAGCDHTYRIDRITVPVPPNPATPV